MPWAGGLWETDWVAGPLNPRRSSRPWLRLVSGGAAIAGDIDDAKLPKLLVLCLTDGACGEEVIGECNSGAVGLESKKCPV